MTFKVLIVDDQEEIRDVIIISIESQFDCTFYEASNAIEAINIISKNDLNLDVVISDFNMSGGNGSILYSYIIENKLKVPYIHISTENIKNHDCFSNFHQDNSLNMIIEKPFTIEQLEEAFNLILDKINTPLATERCLKESGYHRISIRRFLKHFKTPIDIYVHLTKEKYLKIIDKNDPIDTSIIVKYQERGVESIFLTREDYFNFMSSSLIRLSAELDNEKTSSAQKLKLQKRSIREIQQFSRKLGISQQTIDLTNKVSLSVQQVLRTNKNFSKHLKKMLNNQGYVFEHSNLMNYLCSAIAKELQLGEKNIAKLIKSSIFCNITIDDHLAIIQSIDNDQFNSLIKKERDQVKEHASAAIKILEKSTDFLTDEKTIIESHHEKPDGSGFPKKLNNTSLKLLSCVFILTHDFAHNILMQNDLEHVNPKDIIEALDQSYSQGNFAKPYNALLKILES